MQKNDIQSLMVTGVVAFVMFFISSLAFANVVSLYPQNSQTGKTSDSISTTTGTAGFGLAQLKFTDDQKQSVKIDQYRGQKVVFSMLYTSCKMACPLMMKRLKKVDQLLQKQKIQAQFVLISFDSLHDTPELLAKFKKTQDLDSSGLKDRWHFWVGSEKDTRLISNLTEIRFSVNPKDDTINHDNKFILLDEAGVMLKTVEGLSSEIQDSLFKKENVK
jgi:protein SCO1/2